MYDNEFIEISPQQKQELREHLSKVCLGHPFVFAAVIYLLGLLLSWLLLQPSLALEEFR